jgi:hypothetical protein
MGSSHRDGTAGRAIAPITGVRPAPENLARDRAMISPGGALPDRGAAVSVGLTFDGRWLALGRRTGALDPQGGGFAAVLPCGTHELV